MNRDDKDKVYCNVQNADGQGQGAFAVSSGA